MSAAAVATVITPPPRRSSLHHPVQRTPSLTNSDSTTPDGSEEIPFSPASSIAHVPVRPLPVPPGSEKCRQLAQSIPIVSPTPALAHRKSRPRRRRDALHAAFADSRIVNALLPFLFWDDVRALCFASRRISHILSKPKLKDILLARFVPGYRVAMQSRDRRHYEDVLRMDIQDIDLLGESVCSSWFGGKS